MYSRLLSLYQRGLIDDVALGTAVAKGWIEETEKTQIINSKV